MSTKFTPGPWRSTGCAVYGPNIKKDFGGPIREYCQPIACCEAEPEEDFENDRFDHRGTRTPGLEEAQANASLIAAAPTMFDYLTLLASRGNDEAHEIIKKITGP